MKMIKFSFPIALFAVCLIMTSCQKDKDNNEESYTHSYYTPDDYSMMSQYLNLPDDPMEYKLDFPDYYNTDFTMFDKDVATLGRVLFYDKNLSEDRTISCASCHKQELAFSDDVAFSRGINEQRTARNSLALGSVFSFNEYYGSESFGRIPFFWDNRASSVAEQATGSFGNELEMGMEMHEVVSRVNEMPYYAPLFRAAFGRSIEVTGDNVLEAISEFVNSMGTFESKFDEGLNQVSAQIGGNLSSLAQEDFPNYSTIENVGKALYQENCSSCHSVVLSAPPKTRSNNGLEMNYADKGINELTGQSQDIAMFKVPTLRNISLTAPYMHDGRFATLEEVVEHYSSGIVEHQNLEYPLTEVADATGGGFDFGVDEKQALVAFLHTCTDENYTKEEKYSDPFKR